MSSNHDNCDVREQTLVKFVKYYRN